MPHRLERGNPGKDKAKKKALIRNVRMRAGFFSGRDQAAGSDEAGAAALGFITART
jgi:hypothetical protein